MRAGLAVAAALIALAGPSAASARTIDANGNALSGGLSFGPPFTQVAVGDEVSWTNTDFLAPHTATEQHGLWDLAGDFGPPVSPGGFPPGATVSRAFEAGTHNYLCTVHGSVMSGRVAVPVTLRRQGKRLIGIWAPAPPAAGSVFDVEVRTKRGWRSAFEGTRRAQGRLSRRPGPISVRARLRSAEQPSRATGWSPVARLKR